jgi:hypothetical protein
MGRKSDENHSLKKSNSKQGSFWNEENGYPVLDLNKTMTNVTEEPSDTHIKILIEEILEDITEIHGECTRHG